MNLLDELDFRAKWMQIEQMLIERFGKKPDMEGILYLIGVNELGKGVPEKAFTKEQKQDLMHIATCALLAQSGYYEYEGHDAEGWPHYKLIETPPAESLEKQELFLKQHIIAYFED
ncbi:MAG: hypothetical protein R2831_02300 [Chitinophagaceae bacterium]